MSESYPLTFPTHTGVLNATFIAKSVVAKTTSPITLTTQHVKYGGQKWLVQISLPKLSRDNAEIWNSFFLRLDGCLGTFLLGDPNAAVSRGSASSTPGTPLVNGASQTGNLLSIDGVPAAESGYLKAGDYIQLGAASTARLHKVLEDVDTTSNGEATLKLWPDLRFSPNDNASVVVHNAKGLFRLSNTDYSYAIDSDATYTITFDAEEAL